MAEWPPLSISPASETATTVDGLASQLADLSSAVATLEAAGYVRKVGDTMSGPLYMVGTGGFFFPIGTHIGLKSDATQGAILELGRRDGTAATPYIDFHDGTDSDFTYRIIHDNNRLELSGGPLSLGGARLEEVLDPNSDDDAMPRSYADARYLPGTAGNTIYDIGGNTSASLGSFSGALSNALTVSASVPNGVSCTVFVDGWVKFDNTGDADYRQMDIQVGGTTAGPSDVIHEIDLTTAADGTGNTGSGGTGSTSTTGDHQHSVNLPSIMDSGGDTHDHATQFSTTLGDHSHSGPSHAHSGPSHAHAMLSAQWNTLNFAGFRSFTPGASSVTVAMRLGTASGAQTFDAGLVRYQVVVN